MNTVAALEIAAHVAELTRLATLFQVKFGHLAQVSEYRSTEPYRLHQAMRYQQLCIARRLDATALNDPAPGCNPWWQASGVMDVATVSELAREANHLIAACAYQEVDATDGAAAGVRYTAAVIAGILHPDVRSSAQTRWQPYRLDHIISWN